MSQNLQTLSYIPSDPEFYQDPNLVYKKMHELGQPFMWEAYDHVCFADFDSVFALLRDKRLGREVLHVTNRETLGWLEIPQHLKPFYDFEKRSMLEREPPVHTRLRRLVNRAFVSRQIEKLRPRIEKLAHELIDGFEAKNETELLSTFAVPIPVIIIAEMLGVPADDRDQLLNWSHKMVAMYQFQPSRQVQDDAVSATLEFSEYIRKFAAQRRQKPKDDLLSLLVAANEDGETLSEDELITTSILLLNAGHEATVHAIGNGVKTILEEYSVEEALNKISKGEIKSLVEETLRFDTPLHMFTRYVLEPCEIQGIQLDLGDQVGLLLGAANRDPLKFKDPNCFNPDRKDQNNVSFGGGIHFCIGAPLARLELQIAFETLFARLPKLRLAETPVFANRFHFHGLDKLTVQF